MLIHPKPKGHSYIRMHTDKKQALMHAHIEFRKTYMHTHTHWHRKEKYIYACCRVIRVGPHTAGWMPQTLTCTHTAMLRWGDSWKSLCVFPTSLPWDSLPFMPLIVLISFFHCNKSFCQNTHTHTGTHTRQQCLRWFILSVVAQHGVNVGNLRAV